MINSNELLYVVDQYDTPLAPMPRHEVIKNGHWRRTVHVWIINDKKQLLVQKRSLKKDMSPGKWEPGVAGHLGPDDNYFTGAVREVREETGLPIEVTDLNLVKIYQDHKSKEYRGVFFCKWNTDLNDLQIEEDEVAEVKLLKLDTLKKYMLHQKSDAWIYPGYEREMLSALL